MTVAHKYESFQTALKKLNSKYTITRENSSAEEKQFLYWKLIFPLTTILDNSILSTTGSYLDGNEVPPIKIDKNYSTGIVKYWFIGVKGGEEVEVENTRKHRGEKTFGSCDINDEELFEEFE